MGVITIFIRVEQIAIRIALCPLTHAKKREVNNKHTERKGSVTSYEIVLVAVHNQPPGP